MREVFQQELREVQDRLVEISDLVADSIENATEAFNESNVALAETVIADDDKIDALASELDELAIQILARQQPVARDLRIVVSALRISASLERMGDMAEHIAQLARYRFPEKVVPKGLRRTFREMGALDVEIAQQAHRAAAHRGRRDRRRHPQRRRQGRRAAPQRVRQGAGRDLEGRSGRHRGCDPRLALPRAFRRPRGLDREEGAVPRDRRLGAGSLLARRRFCGAQCRGTARRGSAVPRGYASSFIPGSSAARRSKVTVSSQSASMPRWAMIASARSTPLPSVSRMARRTTSGA